MNKAHLAAIMSACTLSSAALSSAALSSAAPLTASVQSAPLVKSNAKLSSSTCANPRGIRVTVRSYFDVTNSDDGFADGEVEVYGAVYFKGQRAWNVARKNAIDANSGGKSLIYLPLRTFDVIYNDSSTWNIIVSGYLNDRDKGSSDDAMWNPMSLPRVLNIKLLAERYNTQRHDVIDTLRGDQKSESADLVFSIVRSVAIY